MRRLLYGIAILIAVFTFSCDTSTTPFDDSLPDEYTLTTNVNPEDGGTVTPSGGEFVDGSRIVLRAEPSDGFLFDEWQGDLTGAQNPAELFIRRNLSITALFAELQGQLNITIVGEGEVIQDVVSTETTGSQQLSAPPDPASQDAAAGRSTPPDTAQDTAESELTGSREDIEGAAVSGPGRLSPPSPGTVQTGGNRVVQEFTGTMMDQVVATYRLTAQPSTGWEFNRWEGDLTGSENPVDVVADTDKNITAVFVLAESEEFNLTVSVTGQGSVSADPDLITYPEGTEVSLTATPDTGWRFGRWSGDLSITDNPATLLMDSNKSVTAEFEEAGSPQFTVTTQPGETVAGIAVAPAPVVTLVDGFGDPVQGENITATLNQNGFTPTSALQSVTGQDGTASFGNLIIETAAEGYQVTFTADDQSLQQITSAPFTVLAAEGDEGNSSATVPDGVAGEATAINITVLDAFGNPVAGAASLIALEVISGNTGASFTAISDQGNGLYTSSYSPVSAGTDEISITLSGTEIAGSPFTSTVITSSVSSANSNVSADPAELVVGGSSTVTVTLRDSQNNPVSGIENNIQVSGLGNASAGAISETANPGEYSFDVTSTVAETITLSVTADAVTLLQNPQITFLPDAASEITLVSGNNQTGTVTQELPAAFVTAVSDQFGNPVSGITVSFSISQTPAGALGQSLSAESAVTGADGLAASILTLGSTQGIYEVTASAGLADDIVFTATAELGVPSLLTLVQEPGATTAGEILAPLPQVEIRDAGGNLLEGVTVTVAEQGGYTFDAGTLTATSDVLGVAQFGDLVIQNAGTYSLVFSADGGSAPDVTSGSFEVSAAAGDAAGSSASVPASGIAGSETAITVNVFDPFGNPVSGEAASIVITVTGANSASPAAAETATPGEYAASYTPTAAGTDNIEITLSGQPLPGSPFISDVTTSDISPSISAVTANPANVTVGSSTTVTVELRDGSGNAIGGLSGSDFAISVSGAASAGALSEITTGVYEFSVSSTTAEQVTVSVSANGVNLDDTPVITFEAGAPTQITITSQPLQTVAGEPVAGTPSILLRDTFNNPVPGIEVTLSEQSGHSSLSGTLVIQTNSTGVAAFSDAVITEAGTYNLVFTSAAGLVATSNAFAVTAAPADPASTTATVPNGAAGDVTSIAITVEDAFGNRVEGVAGSLAVSVSGANAGAAVSAITGIGNGIYTTGYTPASTGDDQISITLDGAAISGSPYTSTVITSNAENVAVTQQPLQTTAGIAIAGPPSVLVTDSFGNPVGSVEVAVTVQTGEFSAGTVSQITGSDGIAVFDDLIINQTGNYILEFNAIGATDNAISQAFDVVPAAPASLNLVSGNNQTGTVTQALADPLAVRVTDAFGNPVESVSVDFAINSEPAGAAGTSLSVTTVQTNAAGEASTLLTLGSVAGTYSVLVSAPGLTSVLFNATAAAGTADRFEFGTVSSPQTAGQPFQITIQAFDAQDNLAAGYNGTPVLSTTAGTITPASALFTGGQAVLNVEVSQAGSAQTITAEDGTLTGTSNSFDVETGGIDPDNSTATVNPVTTEAGSSSVLTIVLQDAIGNTVSGLLDSDFVIGHTGSAVSGTVTETATNGTYETTITNETAETVSVTVTASGVTLTDSPSITFTPAAASLIELVSGNNQSGEISTQLADPLVVRVSDSFNNPVPGYTVNYAINQTPADAAGQSLSNASVQTGSTGEASVLFTLGDKAGTYTVDADGGAIGSVTFSATADIGSATDLIITQQPVNTTAGSVIAPSPEIRIDDAGGNPVEGIGVTALLQGGTFSSGTLNGVTDAGGTVLFDDLVIQSAGNYTLLFSTSATGVADVTSSGFTISAGAPVASNSSATVPNGTAGNPTNISITVSDQFNNPVSGQAGSLSIAVSGSNSASPAVSESGTPGVYTASYTPTVAGTDNVAIALSGSPISGSPYTSQVTTSDISASNSTVTPSPATLQVVNSSTVTVQVRDGSNNPIGGLTNTDFSVSVSGAASAGSVGETATTGSYQFTVTNTTAQAVTVTVTAAGVTLNDTPQITFEAGDVSIVGIQTQPGVSVAGEAIAGPPLVRLIDEFGNRVPGVDIAVTEQSGQSFAGGTLTLASNASGEASFTDLVITQAGSYNLVFTASGQIGTSAAFEVIPAVADPAQTTASVPGGSAGDPTTITITVEDAFGNRVTGVAGNLAVTVSGANAGATVQPIAGGTNGIYTTGYTPLSTGDDQVSITLGGTPISGSPYTSTVITSNAENVAMTQQPLQTTAGTAILPAPSVIVTDNLGNPVQDVEVNVTETGGQTFASGSLRQFTNGSGVAVFSDLVINPAGSYSLTFNAVGVTSNAVSDVFDVAAAAASVSAIVSGNNQAGTVTSALAEPFVVRVTDAFGNPVSGHSVDFAVDQTPIGAAGQSLSVTTAVTNASGEASTTLTLGEISGTYTVTADAGVAGIQTFTATAQPATASSFVLSTIPTPQTAGTPFSVTITAQDAFTNTATGYTGTALLTTTAGTVAPGTTPAFSGGQITLDVSVSEAGTDQTITATDNAITGTSNTFEVQTGGVSAANSTVTANPATLQAGNSSTVTVELRDGSNNPIGGLTNTDFLIGLSGSATAGTITETTTTGAYTFTVSNNTAEAVTVTVTAGGVLLQSQPDITFTASDPDLMLISTEPGASIAGELIVGPPAVRITDEFSNPVPGAEVTVAEQGATSFVAGSVSSVNTNADGFAIFDNIAISTAGSYNLVFASAGVTNRTSNAFSVTAAAADAASTTATVPAGTAGQATTVTVNVEDAFGNPVAGVSGDLAATISAGPNTGATVSAFSDDGGGSYSASYTPTLAGTDEVAITLGGTGISGSPYSTGVSNAAADPASTTAVVPDGTAGNPTTITITVLDSFGNPVSGEAANLAVTVTGDNSAAPAVSETGTAGEYTASYTPTVAGTDNIAITLNSIAISGSSYTSTVTTSDISAANSAVTVNPATLQVGNSSTVTVELRDGSNNPIGGLINTDFSIGLSGSAVAGNVTETATDGTYTFTVSNNTAETVTVSVTASGVLLQDQPDITFEAGAVDLIAITQQPGASTAGLAITGPPTVRLTDQFNNRIPNVSVSVAEQGGQTFESGDLAVLTDLNGEAQFTNLVLGPEGQYNLVFSAATEAATSNAFTVSPADPDPASTTASVPNGSAGDATGITITVQDAFGNRVEGVAADLAASVTSGSNAGSLFTAVTESGNGVYTTSYTPTVTGDDLITITVGGVQIQGSPFTSTVSTSDADAVVITQQPGTTIAGQTIAGPPAVRVDDDLGNPIEGVEVTVSEQGGAALGGTLTLNTASGGIATFSDLVLTQADSYNLVFSAVGVAIPAVSDAFSVTPAAADAAQTSALVPANGTAGEATNISITVEDAFGNPVDGAEGNLALNIDTGQNTGAAFTAVTGEGSGVYSTTYTPTASGTDQITITLGGTGISGSPYSTNVNPAAGDPASTTATVPAGTSGQATILTVNVEDAFGNAVTGEAANLAATVSGGPNAGAAVSVFSDDGGGSYSASYTPSASGDDEITITLNTIGISGSPYTSTVSVGAAASFSFDTITSPQTAGADFGITITALDAGSNTADTYNGTATLTTTAGTITPATAPFTSGIATVSVNVTDAGADQTISAEDGAVTGLSNTFNVNPGAVSASVSTVTASSPHTADGTDASTVTIAVQDANGNPISGLINTDFTVDLGLTSASPGSVSEIGTSGTYTVDVTNSTVESVTVTITADGVVLENTPIIEFQAGTVDATQSTIGADPVTALTANGTDLSTLTITARDGSGNLLEGENVFFDITSGTGGTLSAGPWTTDINGAATATLTSVDANTITVTGYLGVDNTGDVVGTADVEFTAGAPASVSASIVQGSATADGSSELEYLVTVADANANPVSGVSVIASDDGTAITYPSGSTLNTDVNGEVTFRAVSSTVQSGVTFTFTEQVNSNSTTATGSFTDASGFTVADPVGQTAGTGLNLAISDASGIDGVLLDGSINVTVTSDIDGEVHNAAVTFTSGAASVPVTLTTAENHTLTVDVAGVTANETAAVSVTAAAASSMTVNVQPSLTTAGTAISPAPAVLVEDSFGNSVNGVNVTATLSSNDFTGASTVLAASGTDGIAQFTNLVIEAATTGYTITFNADAVGVADVISGPFTVEAASASSIEITTISSPQTAGTPFSITLNALDDFGNVDASFAETADLTTTAGTIDPLTASFVNGTVTLDVSVTQSGAGQTLTATGEISGVTGTSNSFDVDPGAVSASVSSVAATSPHTADGADASTVTIVVQDANGNAITGLVSGDFTITPSGSASTDGIVTETITPGTYTVSVTNAVAETVTVTITADTVTLDDTPSITFQ